MVARWRGTSRISRTEDSMGEPARVRSRSLQGSEGTNMGEMGSGWGGVCEYDKDEINRGMQVLQCKGSGGVRNA